MNTDESIQLDPWNDKNHLLTKDDVYKIYEKVGFKNARKLIKINNLEYYQKAFVHSSYVKKKIFDSVNKEGNKTVEITSKPDSAIDLFEDDYENQEFLGDRILDSSIGFYIYRKYPDTNQGFKTVLKTKLVKKEQLANFATYLGLADHIIVSKQVEEKTEDGRYNIRYLEDCMEAFICAIFLDQNETEYYSKVVKDLGDLRLIGPGWAVANAFIENLIEKVVDFEDLLAINNNYKEQLLQYYQKSFKITPEYVSISVYGPPNKRVFTQGVLDKSGNIIGKGVGKKKTDAEQNASLDALKYFGVLDSEGKPKML